MGQVVPFVARVRDSGDWSAAERARLEDLADRLGAAGVKVEVLFGATDAGDPWCVVTDEDGDVLIHVARIGGVFVVHSAVDDTVSEGADLHGALRDRLAATEEAAAPPSATILPFGMTARQAQTLLALVAATAFFLETAGPGGEAHAADLPAPEPHADTPPPPSAVHDDAAQDREVVARAAAPAHAPEAHAQAAAPDAPTVAVAPAAQAVEATPLPAALPNAPAPAPAASLASTIVAAPAAPSESEVHVIQGGSGNDLLIGTAGDDLIQGGAGDDTLQGGGGHDTLEGGAGNDHIELGDGVVAIGGTGADTFIVQAPHHGGHPESLLGVILDFSAGQGDCIVTWRGETIHMPPRPTGATDRTAPPAGDHPTPDHGVQDHITVTATTVTAPTLPGDHDHPSLTLTGTFTRLDVDLDGDGASDGYLLVAQHGGIDAKGPYGDLPPADPHGEPVVVVVGHALTAGGGEFGG